MSDSISDSIVARVDELRSELLDVSHTLHANPELSFAEHHSAALLADHMKAAGFHVERGAYDLPTSFRAVTGTGAFIVVVCCEYDALPGLGHACGHNTMAAMAVGSARALGRVADELDITVELLGTPAEEHGGGKAVLLERGAWEHATMSLMAHAAAGQADLACARYNSKAVDRFKVEFTGRSAHAAAAPERAINAADAATIAQVAIGLLRQQLPDGIRLSTFVEHGGDVTNIVPGHTVMQAEVRADDSATLDDVKRRMLACFEGAATASGCQWRALRTEPRYDELVQDERIAPAWDASLRTLGREVAQGPRVAAGSTDMGNVSLAVPSIHPSLAFLGATGAPHTAEFAAEAVAPAADDAVVDGAKALALTVAATVAEHRDGLLAQQAARPAGATRVELSDEV